MTPLLYSVGLSMRLSACLSVSKSKFGFDNNFFDYDRRILLELLCMFTWLTKLISDKKVNSSMFHYIFLCNLI